MLEFFDELCFFRVKVGLDTGFDGIDIVFDLCAYDVFVFLEYFFSFGKGFAFLSDFYIGCE